VSEIREYVEQERAKSKRRQFTVTIPAHLGDYIEARAKEEGVTKSAVVEFALRKHKERREG
jgi:hypothetical protein